MTSARNNRLPMVLLGIVLLGLVWSGIGPHDRLTWVLEVLPVLIAVPLLRAVARTFPLTPLAYVLIALHAMILMYGGHYTYALRRSATGCRKCSASPATTTIASGT